MPLLTSLLSYHLLIKVDCKILVPPAVPQSGSAAAVSGEAQWTGSHRTGPVAEGMEGRIPARIQSVGIIRNHHRKDGGRCKRTDGIRLGIAAVVLTSVRTCRSEFLQRIAAEIPDRRKPGVMPDMFIRRTGRRERGAGRFPDRNGGQFSGNENQPCQQRETDRQQQSGALFCEKFFHNEDTISPS